MLNLLRACICLRITKDFSKDADGKNELDKDSIEYVYGRGSCAILKVEGFSSYVYYR